MYESESVILYQYFSYTGQYNKILSIAGIENIGVNKYLAVISSDNKTSINLFGKFNFVKVSSSQVNGYLIKHDS